MHAAALAERCPDAVRSVATDGKISVDERRCVHCYRCVRGVDRARSHWESSYEWAGVERAKARPETISAPPFRRSIHILVVDAGDCGACLNEVKQLNNPYYNMHRLGFFITPTPRHADVLLVVGPVTDHMRFALKKIYDAMPTPKRVVAVGACALSGGVFADSFVCARRRGRTCCRWTSKCRAIRRRRSRSCTACWSPPDASRRCRWSPTTAGREAVAATQ